MRQKNTEKKITRVEVLVHPFFDVYHSERRIPPLTAKQYQHFADLWKTRAKRIAGNPTAVLVYVKSHIEIEAQKYRERWGVPESEPELKKIYLLEKQLVSFLKRMLGNRFIENVEYREGSPNQYYISFKKLAGELKKRNFMLSSHPVLKVYGGYKEACAVNQFSFLMGLKDRFKNVFSGFRDWHENSSLIEGLCYTKYGDNSIGVRQRPKNFSKRKIHPKKKQKTRRIR